MQLLAFWPALIVGALVVAASLHPRSTRRPRRVPRQAGRHAAARRRPGAVIAAELLATARTRPAPALPRATRAQRRAADRATS